MPARTRALVSCLFLVSGATALVYQVTWVRNLSVIFGMSFQATSIVLASFMAGLALGGFTFGRRSETIRRPLRLYGWIEIGVAGFALALPLLLSGVDSLYVRAALRAGQVGVALNLTRIAMAFAVLVIPTFFMGGTLPVLVKCFVSRHQEFGGRLAWLYGVNTLGAVVGSLLAGFLLIRLLGVWHTQLLAVGVNAAVGIAALLLDSRSPIASPKPSGATPASPPAPRAETLAPELPRDALGRLPWRLAFLGTAVCGLCALAFEVMWTRCLTLAVGSTTYSFTVMLAAFLIGIWLGSWLHGVLLLRRLSEATQFGAVVLLIGLSSFATSHWIPRLPELVVRLNVGLFQDVTRVRPAVVLLLAFVVMLVPCVLLGIAFPLAGQARERLSHHFGSAVGDTLGLNTLGSILGSLLAGFVLIPSVGLQRGMLLVASLATAYGALVLGAAGLSRAWLPRWAAAAAAAAAASAAFLLPSLVPPWELSLLGSFTNNAFGGFVSKNGTIDFGGARDGILLRYFEEGRGSTVAVADRGEQRVLLVNGKIVASEDPEDLEHELLLGHLPVLLHGAPGSALVVGLGAGITLGAVAAHDGIERLVVVEIEPAVVEAAREFADANDHAVDAARLEIVFQDGRNFLKTTRETFDVITADPIHPWAYGAAYLFTNEYYDLARGRLNEGGVMCQWLPAYELSPPDFKSVIATFAQSFEHVVAWLASGDVVLVGSATPIRIDLERLSERLGQAAVQRQLALVGLEKPLALLSGFVMDSGAVRTYIEGGIINTDDNLHLEFSAPLSIGVLKYQQLQNLRSVHELRASPETLLREVKPLFASRQEASAAVETYQRAKWSTLQASSQAGAALFELVRSGEDARPWALLEQTNEQLRDVLEETPDYGPARGLLARNLVGMARFRIAQGEYRRALSFALEAVRMAPNQAPAHKVLGLIMGQLRRYDSAIEQLEMARRMRPQDWETHYLLGASLAAAGRDGDAIAVLRQGLALKPDHREMKQRLDQLWLQVHPSGRAPPAG